MIYAHGHELTSLEHLAESETAYQEWRQARIRIGCPIDERERILTDLEREAGVRMAFAEALIPLVREREVAAPK